MSKKLIRLLTLVLAIAMVAGLAVGCGGNSDNPSSDDATNNQTTKVDFGDVNPEDYRGTTVTYVTWKDPDQNEDGPAIDKIEAKYGITVAIQLVSQGTYVSKIQSTIATGDQGDVFFENGTFPSSLTVMQPLTAAKINYDDPIWNQDTIKASTFAGEPFLVDAISNVWTELDICIYNKKLFEDAGITSPGDYYAAGKWNFKSFEQACRDIVNYYGKGYTGGQLEGNSILGAFGCTGFKYADDTMSVGIDSHYYDVTTALARMADEGLLSCAGGTFGEGKTGLAITNAFGIKRTGYFPDINPDHVAATYVPTWEEGGEQMRTGIYRGWGLIRGAKNPVGAGIFLREYLDVNNYDLEQTFHNSDVANFFFQATAQSGNMLYYHDQGIAVASGNQTRWFHAWFDKSAEQVKAYLESNRNVMTDQCAKANAILKSEKQYFESNK